MRRICDGARTELAAYFCCACDAPRGLQIAFFITLVNGAFKLGLVKKRPPFNQLMHVASSCFEVADIDGDNSVSREEFVRWAVNHVASKALVSSFRTVADAERKVHARAARAARLGDVDSALNLVRTHAATDGMQEVLRKQRFHRMRKQRERLISGHHQLVRETQFTMHELKRIQTAFVKRAKGSATLDMDGFCDIMLQECVGGTGRLCVCTVLCVCAHCSPIVDLTPCCTVPQVAITEA